MPIVVAPAPLHQPGTTVTEDVYGGTSSDTVGTGLAQTFVFVDGAAVFGDAETVGGTGRGGGDRSRSQESARASRSPATPDI